MRAIAFLAAVAAASCAPLPDSGTTSLAIRTEHQGRRVAGATCSLAGATGAWSTRTPGFVRLPRDAGDLRIECTSGELPAGSARLDASQLPSSAAIVIELGVTDAKAVARPAPNSTTLKEAYTATTEAPSTTVRPLP